MVCLFRDNALDQLYCPSRQSGAEGGCTHVMYGRNRMTIDPRISTMGGGRFTRSNSRDFEGGQFIGGKIIGFDEMFLQSKTIFSPIHSVITWAPI